MAAFTRRRLIQVALTSGAAVTMARFSTGAIAAEAGAAKEDAAPAERQLELYNTHTRETVSVVYRRGDEYQPPAIASLRHVMRDHRNDTAHDIDLALYDQLYDLARAAGREARFEIISGYRSPESNASMAARPGSGVSKHSLHMEGRAIDVRLREYSCADLRDLAIAAARGGVGYYQRSDFVHIDTGRFRTWNG
jgi:uncharacterized protein YcbK (DUF882 family)